MKIQNILTDEFDPAFGVALQCPVCKSKDVWMTDPDYFHTVDTAKLFFWMGCTQRHEWRVNFKSERGFTFVSVTNNTH